MSTLVSTAGAREGLILTHTHSLRATSTCECRWVTAAGSGGRILFPLMFGFMTHTAVLVFSGACCLACAALTAAYLWWTRQDNSGSSHTHPWRTQLAAATATATDGPGAHGGTAAGAAAAAERYTPVYPGPDFDEQESASGRERVVDLATVSPPNQLGEAVVATAHTAYSTPPLAETTTLRRSKSDWTSVVKV